MPISLSRRHVLAASAAAALPGFAHAAADTPQSLAALGVLYALPLIEMARTRRNAEAMGQKGRFLHAPRLADASSRAVTTPNVDTLYSSAQIDLGAGPAVFDLPVAESTYFSLALMDAWSNNFAVLPAAAPGLTRVILFQAGDTVPAAGGARVIRSPTRHVWALARTFAASNDALETPHAVQKTLSVKTAASSDVEPPIDAVALTPENPVAFFALANRLMAQEGALPADGPVLARLKAVGVGPGLPFVDTADTRAGAASAWAMLKAGRQQPVGGWSYPKADLGDFGTDYPYRAAIALNGLAALPRSEAIYLFAAGDGAGAPGTFDGGREWRLHFAKGQEPPADAFWSLTLYERTPEGRQYLVANPANRFAVASQTPGLTRNPDGSLTIAISAEAPSDPVLKANWLPAPKGPFTLTLRIYKPRATALDGRWRAQAVRIA
ncbi:DUF1254 domain-containing protein [soil metagenome]